MSKQSEAKEKQGYVAKLIPSTCQNCANMISNEVRIEWHPTATKIAEFRCRIGGFAVKKMGSCNEFASLSHKD